MISTGRFRLSLLMLTLLASAASVSAQGAPPDASLFRIFLRDGTTLVSYGEFARVDDRVIFSMVVGGRGEPLRRRATIVSPPKAARLRMIAAQVM